MKSRINWFFHLGSIYYLAGLAWMSTHKMQCEFAQRLKRGQRRNSNCGSYSENFVAESLRPPAGQCFFPAGAGSYAP